MSGDYSRFTHNPRKRFTSVLNQQGRVSLDADWNEAADIARLRARTQALDTFGPVGVPQATTPDGFKITSPVAGDFSIGRGRIYVDGLLAEIFPDESPTYQQQPFLPDPPAIGGTNYVVYLDLWEREVTYIEDAALIDKALGGVDTTTRLQQVWQVKTAVVLGGAGAACGMPVGAPSSGGRMSVSAVAPPAPEDPCVVPPLTGYRGLENRLYRIEVQTPGALGTARFKWSRDNGSLVSSVGGISTAAGVSSIRVGRIGRDQVSRFAIGDWVTVTDDHRELMGEAGDMARIDDIDEANAVLKLDRALAVTGRPFATTPADILARHTRVQKWDQSSSDPEVGADGTISTGAGPIAIEDGIEVSFATLGAEGFHIGDFWVFAARTADASVEEFTNAPPRGIIHTYAQLAAVNGSNVSDCRPQPRPPGEGCCTFVLKPGDDIQQAIDSLPKEGGCICLKTGLYELRAPLVIAANDVSLHGESTGAIIHIAEGPLLTVSGQRNHVHDLQFKRDRGGPAMVTFLRASECVIEDCDLESIPPEGGIGVSIGGETRQIAVHRCTLLGLEFGIHTQNGHWVTITHCMIILIVSGEMKVAGAVGILIENGGSYLRILNCDIAGYASGIVSIEKELPSLQFLTVTGNDITCWAGRSSVGNRNVGIRLVAETGNIAGNRVLMLHRRGQPPVTGIAAGGTQITLADNAVRTIRVGDPDSTLTYGIHLGWKDEASKVPTFDATVRDNKIIDADIGLIAEDVTLSMVSGNTVKQTLRAGGVSAGFFSIRTRGVRYSGNGCTGARFGFLALYGIDNVIADGRFETGQAGLLAALESDLRIVGNAIAGYEQAGIFGFACRRGIRIDDNRIDWIGAVTNENPKLGISILGVLGLAEVGRNKISNIGFDANRNPSPGPALGIVVLLAVEAKVQNNSVGYEGGWEGILRERGFGNEDRALLMQGWTMPAEKSTDFTIGYPALVDANRIEGPGRSALIEFLDRGDDLVMRFERVNFADNDCMHLVADDNRLATTLVLKGRNGLVSANSFRSLGPRPRCVDFANMQAIFIGNFYREKWVPAAAVPAPMVPLNVQI